jgi:vacuolar protein sorting-associated protein VTA1
LGLKASKTTDEKKFLLTIMDWLENGKKSNRDKEEITNDTVACAHLENYSLKLFSYADKNDRESNFSKNVIKAFYTCGMIYDVIQTFGDLSDEAQNNRKYAKWKAAYINNCLKTGETPIPGPMPSEGDESEVTGFDPGSGPSNQQPFVPPAGPAFPPSQPEMPTNFVDPTTYNQDPFLNIRAPSPPKEPEKQPGGFVAFNPAVQPNIYVPEQREVRLDPEQMIKAQKYVKWAGSSLNYDDVKAAIENLTKALRLLQTGQDS